MKEIQSKEIVDLYLKSVELIKVLESKKWIFDNNVLYSSQMHTIRAIGNRNDINLTELAYSMGISKAGASKFINKLLKLDFIEKFQSSSNKKEVCFRLTDKGRHAYKQHEEFSHSNFSHIYKMLDDMNFVEMSSIKSFLDKLIIILENAAKTL